MEQNSLDKAFEAIMDEPVEDETYTLDSEDDDLDEVVEFEEPEETFAEEEMYGNEEDDVVEEDESEEVQVYDWSGKPEELPTDLVVGGKRYNLLDVYKKMQGGYTKKMQALAERERELNASLQNVNTLLSQKTAEREIEDDPRPANPTQDMSEAAQLAQWDKIMQWNSRQTLREAKKNGMIPDTAAMNEDFRKVKAQMEAQERIAHLQALEGWSAEVDNKMAEIVNSDPSWHSDLNSREGLVKLFNFAKLTMKAESATQQAAELESANIRRAANAKKIATPKPKANKKAIDRFAEAFDEPDPFERMNKVIGQTFNSELG